MASSKRNGQENVVGINARDVRSINRSVILNLIRERQPIPRVGIARLSKLNKSTVSSIVASLLREELIVEEEAKSAAVGRNPTNLRLRTGKYLVGALSFDSWASTAAIVDVDGTIRHATEISASETSPEQFVAHCLEELNALRKQCSLGRFGGIGITVAGVVDPVHSMVVFAPNLGWKNVDLGKLVHKICPDVSSITIENDAKAAALAELWFGYHNINVSNFVFLSVGRGIGTGIVIDGHLLEGKSNLAGEFGHMTLVAGGEPCSCGNRGCWEAYASDYATVSRYLKAKGTKPGLGVRLRLENVISSAAAGDSVARDELRRTGHALGLGIANIIKAVDPDAIVIGGEITSVWELVAPQIIEGVKERGFFGTLGQTKILPTSLPGKSALLGAATLSISNFFSNSRVAV